MRALTDRQRAGLRIVHFAVVPDPSRRDNYVTACGRTVAAVLTTRAVGGVTCQGCSPTKALANMASRAADALAPGLDEWEDRLVGRTVRRPDGETFEVVSITETLEEGQVAYVAHGRQWFEYADLVEVLP